MVSIYNGWLSASTVFLVTKKFSNQLTKFILHEMECSIFFGKHWTTQHLRMDVYHQYNTTSWRVVAHNAVETYCTFVPVLQMQQGMVKRVDKWRDTFSKVTLYMSCKYWCAIKGHSLLHTVPSRVEAGEVQAAVLHSPRWHLVMP